MVYFKILSNFNAKTYCVIKRHISNIIRNDFVVTSGLSDINIPNKSLPEFLFPFYEKYATLTFLECGITKRQYTYEQVLIKSENLGKSLRKKLKLNDKDVVALVMKNMPEYTISFQGVLRSNLVLTTISPVFTPDEISKQLEDSNAKVVITETSLYNTISAACNIINKSLPTITVKSNIDELLPTGAINFNELTDTKIDHPDIPFPNPEDLAVLPYSSGTTGLPKGVKLTHKILVGNLLQNSHHEIKYLNEAHGSFQENIPGVLPFYHIFGMQVIQNNVSLFGGKIITIPKFTKDEYLKLLQDHQTTAHYLVPPLISFLTTCDIAKKEFLLKTKTILSGAAPLGPQDEDRFTEKFGDHINIIQGYGLTETGPVLTTVWPCLKKIMHKSNYNGSIGTPAPNTLLKVVDPNDNHNKALGPNKIGELLAKGPQIMSEYLNRPDETKKAFTSDGWFRTGDVSRFNEHGCFFISDRLKDLIKVKGHQVAPAELEELIRSYPDTEDAAVIGVNHAIQGEVPRAYIVPKKGKKFDLKQFEEFFNERCAKYKYLNGGVEVVEKIPKNLSGKILKNVLKKQFLEREAQKRLI